MPTGGPTFSEVGEATARTGGASLRGLARRTSHTAIAHARTRMIAPRTLPITACFALEPELLAFLTAVGVVCDAVAVVDVKVAVRMVEVGGGAVDETPIVSSWCSAAICCASVRLNTSVLMTSMYAQAGIAEPSGTTVGQLFKRKLSYKTVAIRLMYVHAWKYAGTGAGTVDRPG